MVPDEIYNDSNIPHGSAVLTSNAVNYDTDDFEEPQGNALVVKRKNAKGGKNGSFGLNDFLEGSCTVQQPTANTADLVTGNTFTTDVTGVKVWIITKVGKKHPKENYKTYSISFIEQL